MAGTDMSPRTLHLFLPAVFVEIFLLYLPADIEIVAKLALVPLVAIPSLVERAENGLGINAEGYFLCLHGLEQRSLFFLALLLLQLGLGSQLFFFLLRECFPRFSRRGSLRLDLLHLFLDLG